VVREQTSAAHSITPFKIRNICIRFWPHHSTPKSTESNRLQPKIQKNVRAIHFLHTRIMSSQLLIVWSESKKKNQCNMLLLSASIITAVACYKPDLRQMTNDGYTYQTAGDANTFSGSKGQREVTNLRNKNIHSYLYADVLYRIITGWRELAIA